MNRALRALSFVFGAGCAHAPTPSVADPGPCVREGHALEFLRGITQEWLADTAWKASAGCRASLQDTVTVRSGPICRQAVVELTGWGGKADAPDSVAILKAGNRYTAVRVDALDVIMLLDEKGHHIRAGILE